MNVAELSHVETAYDKVGLYDQDAINGFSEQMLHAMLDLVSLDKLLSYSFVFFVRKVSRRSA